MLVVDVIVAMVVLLKVEVIEEVGDVLIIVVLRVVVVLGSTTFNSDFCASIVNDSMLDVNSRARNDILIN